MKQLFVISTFILYAVTSLSAGEPTAAASNPALTTKEEPKLKGTLLTEEAEDAQDDDLIVFEDEFDDFEDYSDMEEVQN